MIILGEKVKAFSMQRGEKTRGLSDQVGGIENTEKEMGCFVLKRWKKSVTVQSAVL